MAPPETDTSSGNTVSADGPGMDEVANMLGSEHDNALIPDLKQIGKAYQLGTPIGANTLSPQVVTACNRHHECLVGGTEFINSLTTTAEALVSAIREARSNYANADQAAAALSKSVGGLLASAIAAATGTGTTSSDSSTGITV
jgi:glutamate-1-semialdehyde aminotransferase